MYFLFGHVLLLLVTELAPKPLQASKSVSALAPVTFIILCDPEEHIAAGLSFSLLDPRTLWPAGTGSLLGSLVQQGRIRAVGGERGAPEMVWVVGGGFRAVQSESEQVGGALDARNPKSPHWRGAEPDTLHLQWRSGFGSEICGM